MIQVTQSKTDFTRSGSLRLDFFTIDKVRPAVESIIQTIIVSVGYKAKTSWSENNRNISYWLNDENIPI